MLVRVQEASGSKQLVEVASNWSKQSFEAPTMYFPNTLSCVLSSSLLAMGVTVQISPKNRYY